MLRWSWLQVAKEKKVGVRSQTVEPSHNEPHHAAFNDMLSKTTRTTKNQTIRVTQQGSSISSMLHWKMFRYTI
jgi:hypothetical protein